MNFSELAKNEFENAPNFKKKEIFNAMCSNQLWIGGKLLISKDSSLSWLIELANGYKSQKEGVRTTKNPYFTTKKEHFDALDSGMLRKIKTWRTILENDIHYLRIKYFLEKYGIDFE